MAEKNMVADLILSVQIALGFEKASLANLPVLSHNAIVSYFFNQTFSPEHSLSSSDQLVDFVQIQEDGDMCLIKALAFQLDVKPNVINNWANVLIKIDLSNKMIIVTECDQCSAENGLCNHVITFLFWLHRVSVGYPSHSQYFFWGTELESSVQRISNLDDDRVSNDSNTQDDDIGASGTMSQQEFLNLVLDKLEESGEGDSTFYQHFRRRVSEYEPIFLHYVLLNSSESRITSLDTLTDYLHDIDDKLIDEFSVYSITQYEKHAWKEALYLRITPDIAYEIYDSKDDCDHPNILDAVTCCRVRATNKILDEQVETIKNLVLKNVENELHTNYQKLGIIISKSHPYMCGSMDGVAWDHVIAIEVPRSLEEYQQFLLSPNEIGQKFKVMLQVQMFLANVSKALYCIASPDYIQSGNLHKIWVYSDDSLLASILAAAKTFWSVDVYNFISETYLLR